MGKATKQWKCVSCKGAVVAENDDVKTMVKILSKDINSKLMEFEKSLQYNSSKIDEVITGFTEMKKAFSSLQKKN